MKYRIVNIYIESCSMFSPGFYMVRCRYRKQYEGASFWRAIYGKRKGSTMGNKVNLTELRLKIPPVLFFCTKISIFCSRKIFIFIFFMFFFRNIADCDVILSYVSLASISRKKFENRMKIHDFITKSYKVVHYFRNGL